MELDTVIFKKYLDENKNLQSDVPSVGKRMNIDRSAKCLFQCCVTLIRCQEHCDISNACTDMDISKAGNGCLHFKS